ncbi:hypothetical protein [Geobacillus sp. 46C-IIa]|nr:hypothetical protein [Geobacillus sp. 46C-IIa]
MLLDEPTNGLDPFWIDRFIDILNQRKNEATIIIFSTYFRPI